MTTRFPSGINNAENMTTLSNMPQPDPVRMQTLFDDFVGELSATKWLVVETQAGATQAAIAGAGGRILLTNSAAIGDVNGLASPLAVFRFTAGKKFYAKCRVFVSDVTNVTFSIGFSNAPGTFPPANAAFVTKSGTTLTLTNINTSVAVANVQQDASGLAASQFFTLGMEYDGYSLNMYYGQESTLNPAPDRKIMSIDAPNLQTGVDLSAFVSMRNVNAVANTATLDYAMFAMER